MLVKEIPFIRICLPLCLGIISGLYLHPELTGWIFLFAISITGLIISVFYNRRISNLVFGAALFSSLYTCGLFMYTAEKGRLSELKSENTMFSAELSDYPEEKQNSVMLTLKLSSIISDRISEPVKGSIIVYHRNKTIGETILPGDMVILRCKPILINNKGNPCEFDYRFYMESRGIKYYAFTGNDDILSVKSPAKRKIRHKALMIRNKIISMYESRGISGERLALVSAITLGEKSQLDPEQKQNFIRAGVMHIMAVSGLHAVILSLFVFNLLFFLKGRFNLIRVTVTILFLWSFAFVTGLTPSVLRATLMFSFLQAGKLMKRRVNGINSVLASAFILILIRPSVIFDAGFLLSYSAVLFIIGFYRDLCNIFSFGNRMADLVWQSVAVTLAAQAGTLALTIMLFNRFPLWFVLTNVLIVPLSSLLIITGCIVPLTYPILPLSRFFAGILDKLTWLTEKMTAKAAGLPLSTIDNIGLTIPECILLAAAVAISLYYLLKKPKISILFPFAALLLFIISNTIKTVITSQKSELIVYNTPGKTTIGIVTGRILNVYSETDPLAPEVVRHSSTMGLKIRKNLLPSGPVFLKSVSGTILISDSLDFQLPVNQKVDYLILTGTKPIVKRNYSPNRSLTSHIITTEAFPGYRPWFVPPDKADTLIWPVRKSGAFIHAL